MGQRNLPTKTIIDGLRYWAFHVDEAQKQEILDDLQQQEYLEELRQEKMQKHLAENWGGDPEGKLAKALEKARKKSKEPRKPLVIERLKAEWAETYASETLVKTSCCCGATEDNPCKCMKSGPMNCSATDPKCPCYQDLEIKNSESFKNWAKDEEKEHGDVSFEKWVQEEYEDEPAHRHPDGQLSFVQWGHDEMQEQRNKKRTFHSEDKHSCPICGVAVIVLDEDSAECSPCQIHWNIIKNEYLDAEDREVSERMTREEAEALAEKVTKMVKPDVDFVEVCGSYRRGRQDPGDLDVIVILKEGVTLPEIIEKNKENLDTVNWLGEKKAQTVIDGHKVDFRTTNPKGKGAALLYFTGPAGYNIGMRRRAKKMGLKLNEYGIWDRDSNEYLGGATEEEIYEILGKSYKPPTDRKGAEGITQFRLEDFVDEDIPAGEYVVEWDEGREEFIWTGGPAMDFNDVWTDILWSNTNISVSDKKGSKVFGSEQELIHTGSISGSYQRHGFHKKPVNYDINYSCTHEIGSDYERDIEKYVQELIYDDGNSSGIVDFDMTTGFYAGEIEVEGEVTWWDSDEFEAVALFGGTQKEYRSEPLGSDGW